MKAKKRRIEDSHAHSVRIIVIPGCLIFIINLQVKPHRYCYHRHEFDF